MIITHNGKEIDQWNQWKLFHIYLMKEIKSL